MRRAITLAAIVAVIAPMAFTPSAATGPSFPIGETGGSIRLTDEFSEPGLHIAPDGTIFVDGPKGLGVGAPNHSALYRSTNGGASWNEMIFQTPWHRLPGGGDSDVAIRPTATGQRIYFLDLWAGSNSISVSENNGTTWQTGTPFTTLPLSDRQWIALGPADPITGLDTVYVLYALIQPPSQVMIARSRTGGLTWDGHFVAPALLDSTGFTGPLVTDEQGYLMFVYPESGALWSAWSNDEGETWSKRQIATGIGGLIPSVAMDGSKAAVAWTTSDWRIRVAVSTDRGQTWGAPIAMEAPDTLNLFPWVDVLGNKVAVAWYRTPHVDGAFQIHPETETQNSDWHAVYRESTNGGATWSSTAVVGLGKTGRVCVGGLSCGLNWPGPHSNRELGDFMSVEIDPTDNRSVVAYGGRAFGVKVKKQIS